MRGLRQKRSMHIGDWEEIKRLAVNAEWEEIDAPLVYRAGMWSMDLLEGAIYEYIAHEHGGISRNGIRNTAISSGESDKFGITGYGI